MKPKSNCRRFLAVSFILLGCPQLHAATIAKADNAEDLSQPGSWTGGVVPGPQDVALWSGLGAANVVSLGSDLSLGGLFVGNTGGNVTLQGANILTLGRFGIDLSAANQDLLIQSNLHLARGAQRWLTSSGRTISLGTGAFTRAAGATLTIDGSGSVVSGMAGLANTHDILGSWAFTGSGAATRYASRSGSNIVPYLGATGLSGITGVFGGMPSGGTGTVNYEVSGTGTFAQYGLVRNINTLRYTGGGATQQSNTSADLLTLNGILNTGTGTLTIGGGTNALRVVIGASNDLVLSALSAGITLANEIKNGAAPGSVTVHGAGGNVVTLSGPNTYTGGTFVNSGRLVAGSTAMNGGPIHLASSASLTFTGSNQVSTSTLTGGGEILNNSANTIIFTGDHSGFTGTFTHSAAANNTQFNSELSGSPQAAYSITAGELIFAANGDYTVRFGSLSRTAGNIRGGNAATGTTTLEIGALNTDSSITGNLNNGATKVLALTKVGTGTLTLSGTNTYSGPTQVNAGTLEINGNLGNTTVTVAANASIGGHGIIGTTSSLTLQNGSKLLVRGSATGPLRVGGDLILDGTIPIVLDGGTPPSSSPGVVPLIQYGGTLTGSAANFDFPGLPSFRNPRISTDTPGVVALVFDGRELVWSGLTANWDFNLSNNWNNNNDPFFDGDSVVFNDSGVSRAVQIQSNVSPAAVTFDFNTGPYSLGGPGSIIGGTDFVKDGTGTLTLLSPQLHTGITYVENGTLAFGVDNPLPESAIEMFGESSRIDLGENRSATVKSLVLDGGAGLIGSGSSNLSATQGIVLRDGSVGVELAGSGAVTKTGPELVTLGVPNTYAGTTTISEGTLRLGVANALPPGQVIVNGSSATLDLGVDQAVNLGPITLIAGTLTGSGTTRLSSTGNFDFRNGFVDVPLDGEFALVKSTAGTVTLTAANSTYSGGTSIGVNATGTRIGVLRAEASQALGTGPITIGLGGNDATARLELEGDISLNNPIVLSARNTTAPAIVNTGGTNTLSGNLQIVVGGGNNLLQSDAGSLVFSGAIRNGTNAARIVTFQGAGSITVSGAIENGTEGGSLAVVKNGAGTLTLSGPSTYSGNTTVNEGLLVVTRDDLFGDASTLTLASLASLQLSHGGIDRVGSLVIDGVAQPDGIYSFGSGSIQVGEGTSPFQTWAASKGLTGAPGFENGPNDDPDGDAVSNLVEFALNGNPLNPADNGIVRSFTQDSNNPGSPRELILTLAVRTGAPAFTGTPSPASTVDGVRYTIEGGPSPAALTGTVSPISAVSAGLPVLTGSGYEYRSFRLDGSQGLPDKGFLRVKVDTP